MRRPPIACHRAVQSLQHAAPQHVWISDELLSSAVNQFFRISHPHQKRYGSHVPGPLEAKRRAAKRKMSISAGFYPQDNFPPPFSLSSLFGFAKQSLPTWRYEPPSLPRKADSLSNSPAEADTAYHPQPQVSADPTISEHDDTQSYTAHSLNAEKEVVEHKESGEVIGLCIDAFKAQLPDVGALTAAKRAQLLATAFEACRPSYPNPWEYNLAVIEYLAQQPWGSFSLVNKIWSFAIPPTFSADTVRLLDSISRLAVAWPKRRAGFANLYCKIVDEYTHGKTLTGSLKNIHDKDLLKMIRQLWHLAPARSANVEQYMLDTLSAIAENVQDKYLRRPLLSILSSLHALEHRIMLLIVRASEKAVLRSAATQVLECLPRALLRTSLKPLTQRLVNNMRRSKGMERTGQRHRYMTWLSMLDKLDHSSSVSEADMTLIGEAISSVQAPMSVPKRSLQKWVEEELELLLLQASIGDLEFLSVRGKMMQILDLAGSSGGHNDDTLTPPQFVATVFAQMQQASLPYHDLLKQFMTASSDNLPATFTLGFLTALQDRNVVIHDISPMDTFYSKKAAKLLDVKACSSRREREHFAYDLHICQRIVDVLSRFSSTHVAHNYAGLKTHLNQLHARYQFEHILERAQAGRALPLAYRQIEATAAHEERVALVHQLAYTYAHDTTMSQREAWRAIYYLYRYLQQNELPIGSLFTRAVVHSCISRPMNERRFVSVSRVAWVCRLVAEVEGKKEAERIEYLFWQWRGDIIKHAITVHERAGGSRNEKTYIGTMKRLDLM